MRAFGSRNAKHGKTDMELLSSKGPVAKKSTKVTNKPLPVNKPEKRAPKKQSRPLTYFGQHTEN